jgi:hypothetical protein
MSAAKRRLPIAITGATLIDGTGRPPLANATIVINGAREAHNSVGVSFSDVACPVGAAVVRDDELVVDV